jgi:hypothetical protein
MLTAIHSRRADSAVLDAFKRQLAAGMAAPLVGERVECQKDFTQPMAVVAEDPNQLSLF